MPHTILGLPTIKARTGGGAEVSRDRWTLSLQFTLLETVDSELMNRESDGPPHHVRARGSRWSPCIPASLRGRDGAIFFDGANREAARVFVRHLIEKKLAIEDERAIFPGGARAVLLTGKALYRALGIPDVRHRRGKGAATPILMRRLLSLD